MAKRFSNRLLCVKKRGVGKLVFRSVVNLVDRRRPFDEREAEIKIQCLSYTGKPVECVFKNKNAIGIRNILR